MWFGRQLPEELSSYETVRQPPFQLHGVVCWVRGPEHATDYAPAGCGIRWTHLTKEAEQVIKRFVDKRDTILYDE